MAKANRLAAKFRIGYVTATVWQKDEFFNVSLTRTYKDGDDLKETSSLGHANLLNATRMLQRAEAWIAEQ